MTSKRISLDGFERALCCIGLAHYKIKAKKVTGEMYTETEKFIKKLEKKLGCYSKGLEGLNNGNYKSRW